MKIRMEKSLGPSLLFDRFLGLDEDTGLPLLVKKPLKGLGPDQQDPVQREIALRTAAKSGLWGPPQMVRQGNASYLVFTWNGLCFLSDLWKDDKPPLDQVYRLGLHLLSLLEGFHNHRKVLNGLTADRIIVEPGSLRVDILDLDHCVDFGLRDPWSGIYNRENLPFLSPEQTGRFSAILRPETDLYNWGALIYSLLGGRAPFMASDDFELFHQILTQSPAELLQLNATVALAMSQILKELLGKRPEERYRSVQGLRSDWQAAYQWLTRGLLDKPMVLKESDFPDDFLAPVELLGRSREMRTIGDLWGLIQERKEQGLVLISGEAGMGKTALLEYWIKESGTGREIVFFLTGSMDRLSPLGLWRVLVERIVQTLEQRYPHTHSPQRQRWIQLMGALAVPLTRLSSATARFWGTVVDASPSQEEGQALRNQQIFALTHLLKTFSSLETALVIAVDDAHLMSLQSAEIFQALFEMSDASGILGLIAFSPDHESAFSWEKLSLASGKATHMKLAALSRADLMHSLETLPAAPDQIPSLSDLLETKTRGIPQALGFFWQSAATERVFTPDTQNKVWRIDLARAAAMEVHESTLRYYREIIQNLEGVELQLLRILSCWTGGLDLETVKELWKEVGPWGVSLEGSLNEILKVGLVNSHGLLRFTDERLRQEVYSQAPKPLLLKVHHLLAHRWKADAAQGDFWQRYQFLSQVLALDGERAADFWAELIDGASRAAAEAAFDWAALLWEKALSTAETRAVPPPRSTLLELTIKWLGALSLSGSRERFNEELRRSYRTFTDESEMLSINLIHAQSMMVFQELDKSLEIGLDALSRLGLKMPINPNILDIVLPLIRLQNKMKSFHSEDILALPPLTDKKAGLCVELMRAISAAVFLRHPKMIPGFMSAQILIGLESGLTPNIGVAFGSYGFILTAFLRQYPKAQEAVRLAEALNLKFKHKEAQVITDFLTGAFTDYWFVPLSLAAEKLYQNYHAARSAGYVSMAFNSVSVGLFYDLYSTDHLEALGPRIEKYLVQATSAHQSQTREYCLGLQEFWLTHTGQNPSEGGLQLDRLWQRAEQAHGRGDLNTYFTFLSLVSMSDYLLDWRMVKKEWLENFLDRIPQLGISTYGNTVLLFFTSLGLMSQEDYFTKALHKPLRRVIKLFQDWAKRTPTNFSCQALILEGVFLARKKSQAAEKYLSRALDQALQTGQKMFAAITSQERARWHEDQGRAALAQEDKVLAFRLFQALGYKTKSALLERILPPAALSASPNANELELTAPSRIADLTAFVKTTVEISRITKLDALKKHTLEVLTANAGADKGFFLLLRQGEWLVSAQRLGASFTQIERPIQAGDLPLSLLNAALHKAEPTFFNSSSVGRDGVLDIFFQSDFQGSCACLPLNRGKTPLGFIYLENARLPEVFSEERIRILMNLTAQISVSLENAFLYEELESRVLQRTRELIQEKERSDQLLLNILPKETADELKKTGRTKARLFPQVTVLILDIEGFTLVAEKLSPQELVDLIDGYFTQFDHISERFGLEKIKTTGDSYMAVGGLPEGNPANAGHVVEAALEMTAYLQLANQPRISAGLPIFEARIGVHTGPVVAGVVGLKKFQFDIWGDTVNLAARMEQNSEPGKINVSHQTYLLLKDRFHFSYRGKLPAKNKGHIEMYFAEGKIAETTALQDSKV